MFRRMLVVLVASTIAADSFAGYWQDDPAGEAPPTGANAL